MSAPVETTEDSAPRQGLKAILSKSSTLPEGYVRTDRVLHTPYGDIHEPVGQLTQVGILFLVFFLGPVMGWLCTLPIGGLTENTRFLYSVPPVLILFLGYSLWVARLHAIGFELIGRALLRLLWMLLIRRQKPKDISEIIPSQEKLVKAAVQAQGAANSFLVAAIPMAMLAGLFGMLVGTGVTSVRVGVYPLAMIAFGWMLKYLGQHGMLPIPDSDAV